MERLADKVGIHANPHVFRHTEAILHLKKGVDLVSLQRLLGHNHMMSAQRCAEALQHKDVENKARQG